MPKCHVEEQVELAASPAAVWQMIGDFADLDWIPGIADATMTVEGKGVGALRRLELEDGMVVERLESYQDGSAYSYSVTEGPLPLANYLAELRVESVGSGSRVSWASDFDPKDVPAVEAEDFVKELYTTGLAAVKAQLDG